MHRHLTPLLLTGLLMATTGMGAQAAIAAIGGAPANDHCSAVTPVALASGSTLTFIGDNTNATFDGDAVPGSLLAQFPFANTWHAFTTTSCNNVTVSYCGTPAGWKTVWRLLTTQCPADAVIPPTTQDSTTSCANHNWAFSFNGLPAGTYYLPVPRVGFGQGGGPYNIQVNAVGCGAVGVDHCADATPQVLASGSSITLTGDNSTATFDGDAVPGSLLAQFPFANTWHAFTTSGCNNVTVSYCGTAAGWKTVWRLLTTQCPADSIITPSTQDSTTSCANHNWAFTFNTLPAGTYYLPVPNVGFGQGGGPYSIEVSAVSCGAVGVDHCADAIPQVLASGSSLTLTGDNSTATFDGDAVPGSLLAQFPFANTWHAFTTTGCNNVTVSYCGTAAGWKTVWRLLTTQCPADAIITPSTQDSTTSCANHNWAFTFNTLPAGTYYLPVPNVGFGQGGGPYSIEVSAVSCGAVGVDHCADATPQALASGSSLTLTGDNSAATFDGDAVPGSLLAQFPFANTWHAFTTTGCNHVTVNYCGTVAGWKTVWRLLTTQCPADAIITPTTEDSTTTCANHNWAFTFNSLPEGTYYLPVPRVGFGQGGGPYSIEVSAVGCTSGIAAEGQALDWTLFPNPTSGLATLAFGSQNGPGHLDVLDLSGRKLASMPVQAASGTHITLDFGNKLAPGQYIVQLSTSTGRSTQRLMVR